MKEQSANAVEFSSTHIQSPGQRQEIDMFWKFLKAKRKITTAQNLGKEVKIQWMVDAVEADRWLTQYKDGWVSSFDHSDQDDAPV